MLVGRRFDIPENRFPCYPTDPPSQIPVVAPAHALRDRPLVADGVVFAVHDIEDVPHPRMARHR